MLDVIRNYAGANAGYAAREHAIIDQLLDAQMRLSKHYASKSGGGLHQPSAAATGDNRGVPLSATTYHQSLKRSIHQSQDNGASSSSTYSNKRPKETVIVLDDARYAVYNDDDEYDEERSDDGAYDTYGHNGGALFDD